MTILKIFLQILYSKFGDVSILSQYYNDLRSLKVSKDMKNFHIYKDFFKTVFDINMTIFCIIFAKCKDINIHKRWFMNSDWLKEIFRLENLNLKSFKV